MQLAIQSLKQKILIIFSSDFKVELVRLRLKTKIAAICICYFIKMSCDVL